MTLLRTNDRDGVVPGIKLGRALEIAKPKLKLLKVFSAS